jgi:hypothetical protein
MYHILNLLFLKHYLPCSIKRQTIMMYSRPERCFREGGCSKTNSFFFLKIEFRNESFKFFKILKLIIDYQ